MLNTSKIKAASQQQQQLAQPQPVTSGSLSWQVKVDVKNVRERLSLTQEQFCERYGFPLATLKNWEQGRRTPDLSARLLLRLIQEKPEAMAKEFQKIRASTK